MFVIFFKMKSRIKKSPSEYPMFAVRLTAEQKDHLKKIVEDAKILLNKGAEPNEKLWMKNDVVYEALLLGIPLLKKKIKPRD